MNVFWSDYFIYRAKLRGYDLSKVESILKYSDERYYDTETQRSIVVRKHDERVVIISYEIKDKTITPITIHAITRQKIKFRIKIGRLTRYE
ncbi:MAG: hypothetical protein HQK79_01155 [Desulfobacterales bacterium]|nr:hypothetical protein [Desulfobacterales bacterium]MBF0396768.1 hypothetical protein [Desulfobacterales bacterium]